MELFLYCPVNPLDVHRQNLTFTKSQAPEPLKDEGSVEPLGNISAVGNPGGERERKKPLW